jgi:hypothetical protein
VPKGVWLKDLTKLTGLLQYTEDATFRKKWAAVKQSNKERLANYVMETLGYKINTAAMFDVQIKRLHEYKRQTLNILGVIHVSQIPYCYPGWCCLVVMKLISLSTPAIPRDQEDVARGAQAGRP